MPGAEGGGESPPFTAVFADKYGFANYQTFLYNLSLFLGLF
jgi:hypothetical protein